MLPLIMLHAHIYRIPSARTTLWQACSHCACALRACWLLQICWLTSCMHACARTHGWAGQLHAHTHACALYALIFECPILLATDALLLLLLPVYLMRSRPVRPSPPAQAFVAALEDRCKLEHTTIPNVLRVLPGHQNSMLLEVIDVADVRRSLGLQIRCDHLHIFVAHVTVSEVE